MASLKITASGDLVDLLALSVRLKKALEGLPDIRLDIETTLIERCEICGRGLIPHKGWMQCDHVGCSKRGEAICEIPRWLREEGSS